MRSRSFPWVAMLLLFTAAPLARADEPTRALQQSLYDQGFYFGEMNGQMDEATHTAIKRFQIRNGLEVTGNADDSTLKAIKEAATSLGSPGKQPDLATEPPVKPSAAPEPPSGPVSNPSAPSNRPSTPEPIRKPAPVEPAVEKTTAKEFFRGTPYASAPSPVQMQLVESVKRKLARDNYFDGEINAAMTREFQLAIQDYQQDLGLPQTGRLDLATLERMRMLPGDSGVPFRRSGGTVYRGVIVR